MRRCHILSRICPQVPGVQVYPQGDKKTFLGIFVGMRQKMGLNLMRCIPADETKKVVGARQYDV